MSKKEPIKSQLRIPADLHESLVRASEQSGRSMNAEIVHRLNDSFRLAMENQELSEHAMQQRRSARILAPGIMGLVRSLEEKPERPGSEMKREVLQAMTGAADAMLKTGEIDSSQMVRWIEKVIVGGFDEAVDHLHDEQSKVANAARKISGQDRLQDAAIQILDPGGKLREAAAKAAGTKAAKHTTVRKK